MRAVGSRALDRILRGRIWVALVGVLLAGIVFSNVSLLQRNREIARTAQYSTELKRANESLRAQLTRLGSNKRVERAAAARGFALPAPGDVEYLRAGGGGDAAKALARLRAAGRETAAAPTAAGAAPDLPQAPTPPAEPTAATTQQQPSAQAPAAVAPNGAGVGQ